MPSIRELPAAATRQGGVFSAVQALADGWTSRQIRRRIDAGRWAYVAGIGLGRRLEHGAVWTDFQLAVAARLTMPGSVISHHTAARLHGFPMPLQRSAHLINRNRRDVCRNIEVHRLHVAAHELVTTAGGLVVTDPQRTAVDLLATVPLEEALDLWSWTSSRSILDRPALEAALVRRYKWSGSSRLRELLRTTRTGPADQAELRLHDLLRVAGITGWEAGATVVDGLGVIGVVDLLFEAAGLVVEMGGFLAHSGGEVFVRDRRRQHRLVEAGYVVLRFSRHDLVERPDDVIAEIRRCVARRDLTWAGI
jgi:hypothetical protein